ncbi:MAG: alpha-amylase, partial [Proteobacteria bacterium]|nr:alpha-amylase [Pseudomonadota bacterium]
MKRIIALRNVYRAFGRGAIEFLHPENQKILTFIRSYEDECILVVANLSRFVQCAELDLSAFKGMVPIELFGRAEFPPIGELPYFLTLAPHGFYWFSIETPRTVETVMEAESLASQRQVIDITGSWENIFGGKPKERLEGLLPLYLRMSRWFGGKGRAIRSAKILEVIPVPSGTFMSYIALVQVDYRDGDPEIYLLPVVAVGGEEADHVLQGDPRSVIARIRLRGRDGDRILHDASVRRDFCEAMLGVIARRRQLKGKRGILLGRPTKAFRRIHEKSDASLEPSALKA